MRRWRVAALALLVAGGATLAGLGNQALGAASEPSPSVVVVGPGETVWDLVAPHVPEGASRSAYVAEVVAVNELDPLRVPPGTPVRLP